MDDLISQLLDENIAQAKKRIWNKMQSKLPERGVSSFQPALSALRTASENLEVSRLKRVQVKERLLSTLPEREAKRFAFSFSGFPKRTFAVATLSAFFAFLFVPVFQGPQVYAESLNTLEVAQGNVYVNGELVGDNVNLREGDTVFTDAGAMAHIVMLDDSRITLAPRTQVTLTTVDVDSQDRSVTSVVLDQSQGRVWAQVVNLEDQESYLILRFPNGAVTLNHRATVDVRIAEEETELQVVQNLVRVSVSNGEEYEGTLGKGARMLISGEVELDRLTVSAENDVWWSFNDAYGKDYLRHLDEKYTDESVKRIVILPGNPLYIFKTFREEVQEVLTFRRSAKQDLVAQHAQNRLDEASILMKDGDVEAAELVMNDYKQKVALIDNVDLLKTGLDGGQNGAVFSASQKLRLVPELLEAGDFDGAAEYLAAYRDESLSLLAHLESLTLEDRGPVVSELLEKKLEDFQMLRVISSMSEAESFDGLEANMLEELSMMVLSLRERSLNNLSEFFAHTEYNLDAQREMYSRLMETVDLSPALSEQFDEAESNIVAEEDDVIIDVGLVEEVVDERWLDFAHSDESEGKADGGE